MIGRYLVERRSWLLLLLFLHLLIVFVAFIDTSIPLMPILYITLLSSMVCLVFIMVRYQQETKFYKQVEAMEHAYDPAALRMAESPFERIVEEAMSTHSLRNKKEASGHMLLLEQEKDELLSWIHEVKTPLTAMQLMIDRLAEEPLKSRLNYEWLRIHLLLDQQLHLKRIPFIENDLYIEDTWLEPVIHKEIKDLRSWCIQKGIGFDLSLEADHVLTDAKWLGFIVRQILTNAVKYSEASDIEVRSFHEEGHVMLMVQDYGRGISAKDLPRIFDRGFTSTVLHQDSAATGMGLYLAHKAAESLHIRIEVESVYGKGSTFRLAFPVPNDFDQMTGM
ncbi:OmpR family two-component system bacitracin resistance sensor histidine kinase BceS [Paenibacillus phyllosphaerae]|uniref:histidine kinase n=1 Tax=Paenibacillus phyllosphaerae TaxID=274593 RepID=A0A7W5B264_9BACL|nr:sensor histidine kinase [Paenibacillus phyllosphaerae]MBB3113062.1 OmpR family two-component system bacitracin resistance sensor histidine kinase BceS [Paenibacillus phyllosphaerae]